MGAQSTIAIGFQDDTTPKASEERIGAQRADAGGQGPCVAYDDRNQAADGNTHHTLRSSGLGSRVADAVQFRMSVRRLTPVECERLQGFPDNWTLIPGKFKNRKPQDWTETINNLVSLGIDRATAIDLANGPDGPRYKAIGNSMAVPCMAWIGRRIQMFSGKAEVIEL